MSDYLLVNLYDKYTTLIDALNALRDALSTDSRPVWLPEPFQPDRALAAKALVEIWHQDQVTYPPSGLICVGPEHLELIEAVNTAKTEFRTEIVDELQAYAGLKKAGLKRLVSKVSKGRNEDTAKALKKLGLDRLNLNACYRKILVLPPLLDAISWSWTKGNKAGISLDMPALADKIKAEIPDENEQTYFLEMLDTLPAGTQFAVNVKKVASHLRANYLWYPDLDSRAQSNKRARLKSNKLTPTVVVCQDDTLPGDIIWRDPEEARPRLKRSDAKISEQAFIRKLGVYTYTN